MPARPKELVFILGEQEIDRLDYDPVGRELLANEDILVVSIDQTKSSKLIDNLKSRGVFRRSVVLAKSPYDDENYEDITHAMYEFAVEKYMYFSQFCNLLGAKEVTVQRLDKIMRSQIKSLELIAKLTTGQQEILAKDQELNKLHSQIHVRDVFSGSTPNMEEAEKLLREKRLLGDTTMFSLLNIRRQTSNPISNRQLTLNLSNESRKIIDIVAKIRLPKFLSEIGANFNTVEKKSAEYTLTLEVKF